MPFIRASQEGSPGGGEEAGAEIFLCLFKDSHLRSEARGGVSGSRNPAIWVRFRAGRSRNVPPREASTRQDAAPGAGAPRARGATCDRGTWACDGVSVRTTRCAPSSLQGASPGAARFYFRSKGRKECFPQRRRFRQQRRQVRSCRSTSTRVTSDKICGAKRDWEGRAGLGPCHPGLGLPGLALSWGAGSLATFAPAVFVAQLPGGRWPLQLLRPSHSSDVTGCAYF